MALAVSLTSSPRHPKAVVEDLLSHHVVFCRAPAALPVGSGPFLGVIRLFSSVQWSSDSRPPDRHTLQLEQCC